MSLEKVDIKRSSAADEVFKILHERISSGRLKPGDKLPAQDELARQLGVSRNTLREAIYKLTVMGLVSSRQGVGTVINITNPAGYISSLSDHLLLQSATVREFIEARIFVEKTTVRLAAIRAAERDMTGLGVMIDRQREAYQGGDLEEFTRLDAEFHLALARACSNNVLKKFLESVQDLLGRFIGEVVLLPGSVESAIGYHTRILEWVRARDAGKAEEEMLGHLQNVVNRIISHTRLELDAETLFQVAE